VLVVSVVSVAVGAGAGRLLFFEDGGFGLVPIVSIAEVAEVAVVSLFVPVPFFGIGVFGMRAGGGAFAGAAVDGANVVVGAVVVVGAGGFAAAGFVPIV
jgi:hypothetical protein